MTIEIPNKEDFLSIVDALAMHEYGNEVINEVKSFDRPHGEKLSHAVLHDFFKNKAPALSTLADVEMALHALYKKNGIEFTRQGVKQVISNYKKRIDLSKQQKSKEKSALGNESVKLDEMVTTLSQKELKKRELILRALKKKMKELKNKYGSDAESVMYAIAHKLAKQD